jgi:hypothetical protein
MPTTCAITKTSVKQKDAGVPPTVRRLRNQAPLQEGKRIQAGGKPGGPGLHSQALRRIGKHIQAGVKFPPRRRLTNGLAGECRNRERAVCRRFLPGYRCGLRRRPTRHPPLHSIRRGFLPKYHRGPRRRPTRHRPLHSLSRRAHPAHLRNPRRHPTRHGSNPLRRRAFRGYLRAPACRLSPVGTCRRTFRTWIWTPGPHDPVAQPRIRLHRGLCAIRQTGWTPRWASGLFRRLGPAGLARRRRVHLMRAILPAGLDCHA